MANEYPWLKHFEHSVSEWHGYVSTYQKTKEIVKIFEDWSNTKYVVYFKNNASKISETNSHTLGHFVRFEDAKYHGCKITDLIKCDNVPYICKNIEVLECHRGVNHDSAKHISNDDHGYHEKKRNMIQCTKKRGCLARITIREIQRFPEFKIEKDSEFRRKKCSQQLREELKNNSNSVKSEQRFYISLPALSDHNHDNDVTEDFTQTLDRRLRDKIYQLVNDGIDNTNEIKHYLHEFVDSNKLLWFSNGYYPSHSNKRFFPSNYTIRNHIYLAIQQNQHSKLDQENLKCLIDKWTHATPEDTFFFQMFNQEENTALLFVYQSKNQKHLLKRYGNEACLLDATYKTSKYALPLFFLVVKTNVDFQPVAVFVTMNETTESICNALQIVKLWNAEWKPKYFMTDYSEAEIKAVEKVFPNADTFLCDFHKEQSWERWLNTKEHGVNSAKAEILIKLRKISHSESETEFHMYVNEFKASTIWKNSPKLQNYYLKAWEPYVRKWVWCYRSENFLTNIKTNNGIERLNGEVKNDYLRRHKDKTLSGVIKILYVEFFVEKFNKYVEKNISCLDTIRSYSTDIPDFLHNRPRNFIIHCLKRMNSSTQIRNVSSNENLTFTVQSEENNMKFYTVKFAQNDDMPFCQCHDWNNNRWPCKHMFAVLREKKMNWQDIGEKYMNSVFNTLDNTVTVKIMQPITNTLCPSTPLLFTEIVGNDEAENGNSSITDPCEKTSISSTEHATECRILLKELTNLTYVIEDYDTLLNLRRKLDEIHNWASSKTTHIDTQYTSKPTKKTKQNLHSKNVTSLPKQKKRKRTKALKQ